MGIAMPVIATVALLYAFYGRYMPEAIMHRGVSPQFMLSTIFLTTEGIWGTAMGVAANVIVYFMIFTSFLSVTGANDAFLNVANALVGKVRGGPAKIAVVGSAIVGTTTGSSAANVAATGGITIPLMKKLGYKPEFAAAVESAASAGGQIIPPILGTSAFIMAEVIGVPYATVMMAALIPAVIYYLSIFVMVDLEARKHGLAGLPEEEVPVLREMLIKYWPVLIPLILLISLLIARMTPGRAALFSLGMLIVASTFRKETRLNVKKFIQGLEFGSKDMAMITVVCGVAGIVIGVLARTGLGPRLAEIIVAMAGGNMIVLLLLTMLASLILGMGMPTVAAYILLALAVAPAIIREGINPLAAHFFVFYYGIFSAITPPVAIVSITAAGIAKSNVTQTCLLAVKLAAPAFILPFMFIYVPEMLMIPTGQSALYSILVISGVLVGTLCTILGLQGYYKCQMNVIQRLFFFIAAIMLITPEMMTSIVGLVFAGVALTWHFIDAKHTDKKPRSIE